MIWAELRLRSISKDHPSGPAFLQMMAVQRGAAPDTGAIDAP